MRRCAPRLARRKTGVSDDARDEARRLQRLIDAGKDPREELAELRWGVLALPSDMRARFLHIAEMLAEFGPQRVRMPHVRPLEGKLWEIRMMGPDGMARAIYVTRTRQRLVVLHVFVKKTQKTPRRAIETAYTRMNED